MFGVEEYFSNLINEAKSQEEIYRILEYQLVQGKGVPMNVFREVFQTDPTKKKSYTRWLLNRWNEEQDEIYKLMDDGDLSRLFRYFQSRQNSGLNLTDFKTVEDAINSLPEIDRVLTKNGNGGPEDDYDIVYDTPEWKIAVPNSYPASQKLGQGCRWCTAGAFRNGLGYFNSYTEQGPLWINFKMGETEIGPTDNKEYPYTRYQFCFESRDFMDANDERIDSFESIGLPEGAISFYTSQNEIYGDIIENGATNSQEEYEDIRGEHSVLIKCFENTYLNALTRYNDDYEFFENDDYLLYDQYDNVDSISDCIINIQENFVVKDYGEKSSAISIKDCNGKLIFCFVNESGYYDAVEDVFNLVDNGNVTVFHSYFYVYLYSHELNKLYEYSLEQNNISSIYCRRGLPIYGDEKNIFDSKNIYIEVLANDGSSMLLKFNPNVKSNLLRDVVGLTALKPGEHFEVTMKNGVPHIVIKDFEYCLDDNSILANYKFSRSINQACTILENRDGSGMKNIWDKEDNKFLFKYDMRNIMTLDNGYCDYVAIEEMKHMFYLYNVSDRKKFGETYYAMEGVKCGEVKYVFGYVDENNKRVDAFRCLLDKNGELQIFRKETFTDVIRNDKVNQVIYSKNENGYFLENYDGNLLISVFDLKEEFQNRYIYGVKNENNLRFIFDKKTQSYLAEHLASCNLYNLYGVFEASEKTYVIPKYLEGVYTFDEVLSFGYTCCAVLNGDKIYFINSEGKLVPKNGLNRNEIVEINHMKNDTFAIKTSNDIWLKYHAFVDEVEADTPEQETEARRLFKIGINEVKEKFYEIFNKINNVRF